jgi:hypothetical protein
VSYRKFVPSDNENENRKVKGVVDGMRWSRGSPSGNDNGGLVVGDLQIGDEVYRSVNRVVLGMAYAQFRIIDLLPSSLDLWLSLQELNVGINIHLLRICP